MDIKIVRRITFEDFGEEFKDSYLDINEPSIRQAAALQSAPKTIIDYVEKEFVEGKMWNGKETVVIEAKEVLDLPMSVLQKIGNFFLTQASKKQSE